MNMPNWLHNYFVRFGNRLITRGFIGIAVLAALVGYSQYSGQAMRAPAWAAFLFLAFFVALIIVGVTHRGKEIRGENANKSSAL